MIRSRFHKCSVLHLVVIVVVAYVLCVCVCGYLKCVCRSFNLLCFALPRIEISSSFYFILLDYVCDESFLHSGCCCGCVWIICAFFLLLNIMGCVFMCSNIVSPLFHSRVCSFFVYVLFKLSCHVNGSHVRRLSESYRRQARPKERTRAWIKT